MKRVALVVALFTVNALAHDEDAGKGQLGKVKFPTSCSPKVQDQVTRGVAMLHSFWYRAGERDLPRRAGQDPTAPSPPGASPRC